MTTSEITRILMDKGLARLGDAYVNLVYSLALTEIEGQPTGAKVSDRMLAEAARKSGLRRLLPKRTRRDDVADAVEALLVCAWRSNLMTAEEAKDILKANQDLQESFSDLIKAAAKRIQVPL